jgi:hypothetical protein
LAKYVEEVDAGFLKLSIDHDKATEELCQVCTSEEGFWKLSEILEAQLSASKDASEKNTVDLEALRERCGRYCYGFHYWKAKVVRYLAELSFVPWLRDLLWLHGFHWGFENCWHPLINQQFYGIDHATVASNHLSLPTDAIRKMVDDDRELIPKAPKVNPHRH